MKKTVWYWRRILPLSGIVAESLGNWFRGWGDQSLCPSHGGRIWIKHPSLEVSSLSSQPGKMCIAKMGGSLKEDGSLKWKQFPKTECPGFPLLFPSSKGTKLWDMDRTYLVTHFWLWNVFLWLICQSQRLLLFPACFSFHFSFWGVWMFGWFYPVACFKSEIVQNAGFCRSCIHCITDLRDFLGPNTTWLTPWPVSDPFWYW